MNLPTTPLSPIQRALHALDFVFILRPTQFFPLWATMFAGIALGANVEFFSPHPFPATAILSSMLCAGHIYLFNQIIDRENDAVNKKLFILESGVVSLRAAWIEGIMLVVLSLALAWTVSNEFFYVVLFSTALGLAYSFLGLMNRPIISAAMNASGGVTTFLAGAYAVPPSETSFFQLLFFSLPFGLAWAAVFVLVTLPDVEGDRQFGKRTLAVHYGVSVTLLTALVLDALALAVAIATLNAYVIATIGLSALVSLPLFWQTWKRRQADEIFLPVKYSMLCLAITTACFLPLSLALAAFTFFACKFYYGARFGLDYPNFGKK